MQGPVRTILISVIYLASALVAFPQAASRRGQTVTGSVSDPSGAGVVGIEVSLKPEGRAAVRTTRTSAEGVFQFNAVPLGKFEVGICAGRTNSP